MTYSFKESGHQHLWDGKRMTGVTTILGVIAKPMLIQWAANMAVDYIASKTLVDGDYIMPILPEYKTILEEARKAHTKKRDAAADVGSTVHEACEEWAKNKVELPLDEQGKKMFENFTKWIADNKATIIESEKHVWSESLFCAGILDGVVEIEGQYWLYDIKTGSGIYPEAIAQMSAYVMMLEEMKYDKKVAGCIVLNLKKDGTFAEARVISLEEGKRMFLAAYDIYKIQQKLNSII